MCKLDEVKNQNTEDDQIYRQENEKSLIPFWAAKNITDICFDMGLFWYGILSKWHSYRKHTIYRIMAKQVDVCKKVKTAKTKHFFKYKKECWQWCKIYLLHLPWILLCQRAPLCHIQFHFCFLKSTKSSWTD